MPKMQTKPSAPPVTGAPPTARTTPLFPVKGPAQPVPAKPAVSMAVDMGIQAKPSTPAAATPSVQAPPAIPAAKASPASAVQAPNAPTITSAKVGVVPPRVIVANPQAKVYVQSGKIEVPPDIEPIPHNSKPPALPATQNLPKGFSNASNPSSAPAAAVNPTPTPSVRAPEPLTPQPPLIPSASSAKTGVQEPSGRPTLPDGKIAPVQIKKPTASLRLVDLPVTPGSRDVTQAMEVHPTPVQSAAISVTKPASVLPPQPAITTPAVKAPAVPPPQAAATPVAPKVPAPPVQAPTVPKPASVVPLTTPPVSFLSKTSAVPPPPPPSARNNTRKLELTSTPISPSRPAVASPIKPALHSGSAAVTAPVDTNKPQKKSSVIIPPSRVAKPAIGAIGGSSAIPPAAAVSPQEKATVAPPRRTQSMSLAAAAVASAATPKVIAPVAGAPAIGGTPAVKPIAPITPVAPGDKPAAVMPISPIKPPGAISPIAPVSGGVTPMKPVSATPAVLPEGNKKSGTSVIKNAPPKETARITVMPNLSSGATPRAGVGNLPVAKPPAGGTGTTPVVGAAAAVAAVGGVKAVTAAPKPVSAAKPKTGAISTAGAPIAKSKSVPIKFQDEESTGSTMVTTMMAAGLALMTWGTAGLLLASVLQYI